MAQDEPLVSVVTVCLNQAQSIAQCFESVIGQSYPRIEYIVLDGGSTDGTLEVIERYRAEIDQFVSEPDSGPFDAMNKGIGMATGEFVLILNSDDWYDPDAVRSLVDAAQRSAADVVHAQAHIVDMDDKVVETRGSWHHDGILTSIMPYKHETMLVRRDVYQRFGHYDPGYQIIADYEYAIRLYLAGCRFEYLPRPLLYFRLGGLSRRALDEKIRERGRLFHALHPFLSSRDAHRLAVGVHAWRRFLLLLRYGHANPRFARSIVCYLEQEGKRRGLLGLALWLARAPAGGVRDARWSRGHA